MAEIKIIIDEKKLKELISDHLYDLFGSLTFAEEEISIMVKSKQNYKSEWEKADFKAEVNKSF